MPKQLVWLDLCSGLGGASQPALDRGWRVIRVDIDPRFKPDIVADLRALPLQPFHVDVLWASPPCNEFVSHAFKFTGRRTTEPDLSCVRAVMDLSDRFRPAYWILENVWAARKYICPLLGSPVRTAGHCFWGWFPCLLPETKPHKGGKWRNQLRPEHRARLAKENGLPPDHKFNGDKDMAAWRAKIPYEIGEAICRAVEQRAADAD